jgi:hypothetical protein
MFRYDIEFIPTTDKQQRRLVSCFSSSVGDIAGALAWFEKIAYKYGCTEGQSAICCIEVIEMPQRFSKSALYI